MSGRFDDLRVLKPDPLVLVRQVAGGATDVVRTVGLAGDAWDPQEVFELAKSLLSGVIEKLFGGRHDPYCHRCHGRQA